MPFFLGSASCFSAMSMRLASSSFYLLLGFSRISFPSKAPPPLACVIPILLCGKPRLFFFLHVFSPLADLLTSLRRSLLLIFPMSQAINIGLQVCSGGMLFSIDLFSCASGLFPVWSSKVSFRFSRGSPSRKAGRWTSPFVIGFSLLWLIEGVCGSLPPLASFSGLEGCFINAASTVLQLALREHFLSRQLFSEPEVPFGEGRFGCVHGRFFPPIAAGW